MGVFLINCVSGKKTEKGNVGTIKEKGGKVSSSLCGLLHSSQINQRGDRGWKEGRNPDRHFLPLDKSHWDESLLGTIRAILIDWTSRISQEQESGRSAARR